MHSYPSDSAGIYSITNVRGKYCIIKIYYFLCAVYFPNFVNMGKVAKFQFQYSDVQLLYLTYRFFLGRSMALQPVILSSVKIQRSGSQLMIGHSSACTCPSHQSKPETTKIDTFMCPSEE